MTEVNYGEVAVNSTTRYTKNGQPLKLASDVSFSSVSFTLADGTISASISPDKTIYLNITPSETGEYTSNITVSAPGFDDLVLTAYATAVSLSYNTIQELKENFTKLYFGDYLSDTYLFLFANS